MRAGRGKFRGGGRGGNEWIILAMAGEVKFCQHESWLMVQKFNRDGRGFV
jgi:hypothetical protein